MRLASKERARKRHIKLLTSDMDELVQLKEYAGQTYISYNGIPMLELSHLSSDPIDALKLIRKTIVDYQIHTLYGRMD